MGGEGALDVLEVVEAAHDRRLHGGFEHPRRARIRPPDPLGRREDVHEHEYEPWTANLQRRAEAAGLRGRRLLDVACGTGKSFLPFLARGFSVTAVDVSPRMVALAAAKAGDRARLEVHDMRS